MGGAARAARVVPWHSQEARRSVRVLPIQGNIESSEGLVVTQPGHKFQLGKSELQRRSPGRG